MARKASGRRPPGAVRLVLALLEDLHRHQSNAANALKRRGRRVAGRRFGGIRVRLQGESRKAIFHRLVHRNPRRTAAEIQADVRQFMLSAPFELEQNDLMDVSLESPVGDRRRINVEAAFELIG